VGLFPLHVCSRDTDSCFPYPMMATSLPRPILGGIIFLAIHQPEGPIDGFGGGLRAPRASRVGPRWYGITCCYVDGEP
jgi:hypothetical protein